MSKPNSSSPSFGFLDFRDKLTAASLYPALTLISFMRREPGLEVLTLGATLGMTFVMYSLDGVSRTHISLFGGVQTSAPGLLSYFAVAFLILALWKRHQMWKVIRSGRRWVHTATLGESFFTFLPLRPDRIQRNVDPAIAFIAGLCLRNLGFTALGVWIMFAAICWRVTEENVYQQALKEFFAENNSLLEAEVRAMRMQQMNEDGTPRPLSLRETGGIPTGLDHELETVIAQRRKQAAEEGYGPDRKGTIQ